MRVQLIEVKGTWRAIADSARTTIGRMAGSGEPSSNWKRRMLLAEHSPIRKLIICWKWYDLKSWVSVHFVRHWVGIVHWVRTQRTDRTGVDRNELTQDQLLEHECEANAQAIINISRKRLCNQASYDTRLAWTEVLNKIYEAEPQLAMVCVPDCIYRGWCYEYESCGFHKTEAFQIKLEMYREGINDGN